MSLSTSYPARHERVRHVRGSASGYACAHGCGRQAAHWATIHDRDGMDPQEDYLPLCVLCHSAYDDHSGAMRRRAAAFAAVWENRACLCYDVAVTHPIAPNVPLHIQVADIYRRRIAAGELPPGTRMPTVRDLAREYEVSISTAGRAVDLLAREHLVETRGRRGTVVSEGGGR